MSHVPALCFLIVGVFALPVSASDVQTLSSSHEEIIFEFRPQGWSTDQKIVNGSAYFHLRFDNSSCDTKPGEPLLPERVLLFAVPPNASVTMDVVAAESGEQLRGKPLPTPAYPRDGLGKLVYSENEEFYRKAAAFPEELVSVSPVASLRYQHVVIVRISPVQFFPDKGYIQLYQRIVVRLRFNGGENVTNSSHSIGTDAFYSNLFVNPEQAHAWRLLKRPVHSVKKSSRPGDCSRWIKIFIRDEGMYKLTGADLENAGIVLSQIQPGDLQLFNNGGVQTPVSLRDARPDSLMENAIFVSDGNDGRFDDNDYVYFYGKSVNNWKWDASRKKYVHYLHRHTNENVYWLTWQGSQAGKRMVQLDQGQSPDAIPVTGFLDYIYVEHEYKNLLNSGVHWLGNYFSNSMLQRNYQLNLEGAIPSQKAWLRVQLVGVSQGKQSFQLYMNENFIGKVPEFYASSGQTISMRAKEYSAAVNAGVLDGYNTLTVEYTPYTETALAYMDWIELSFSRRLKAQNDELYFYSPDSIGTFSYHMAGFSTDEVEVFDVTRFNDVARITGLARQDDQLAFVDTTLSAVPKRFIALSREKFKSPEKIEREMGSWLRNPANGADFIIIAHDDFFDAALGLKSLRENCDTLNTEVVKISDIYDEFSWGLPDAVAIRDFIHYAYFNWAIRPDYILLFGDGDYDYKNIISPNDPNRIPPFETDDWNEGSSRPRDDWFVCVDGNDNLLDLAIGRIPVQNPDEAYKVVEKIVNYETHPAVGDWCNSITMVADDEFESAGDYDSIDHIPDAEAIAEHYIPESYQVSKIYLTEYPAVRDAATSGIRKPAAQQALIEQVNRGNLIVNFIGHGNERVWAHENVLNISDDLPRIANGQKQAFWIAATCDFGRFDNPALQCFAEQLVTLSGRGAIAVFSASRLANPDANVNLNKLVYNHLFKAPYSSVRLGDVVAAAKNASGNNENDQFYHLLGDPTLRLMRPSCLAHLTEIAPDSIKALCTMKISGDVALLNQPADELNGTILLKAFDSEKDRVYTIQGSRQYHYKLPGSTIFRGEVSVARNQYSSQFIIPKDITYGGTEGRVSVFYYDEARFGAGYRDGLPVGGTEMNFTDTEGPHIQIQVEGQNFMDGGFMEPNAMLKIIVADEKSGVNIVGDIGHKITLTFDNDEHTRIDVTEYFQYDVNSYLSGTIRYSLVSMDQGKHLMCIKAWDNFNNSATCEAEFTVVATDELVLRDVLNYPNPFSTHTVFTFWVNQPCQAQIKIFTIAGRLVRALENVFAETGFNQISWDGRDADGDLLANGIYLYKLETTHQQGSQSLSATKIDRCVVLR
ncbi:MAG: type IX secretion system sortase PorU [Candidatus Zhuqueibacterota bacterium]